jgi:hypothetical protein
MAKPDPAYLRRVDYPRYFLTHDGKHVSHARLKQQRLIVLNEKLIEL